jgi:deoxyribose-phosphate aldolase
VLKYSYIKEVLNMEYAKLIDHTILKADAYPSQIIKLCEEAKIYHFKSVCINPSYVKLAKAELKGSDVLVCTVIGFPLGTHTSEVKAFETKKAVEEGADEVDMVINVGLLKAKDYSAVLADIKAVVAAAKKKTVKVIIETCLLTDEEKIKAAELVVEAKADFVKTSTGFSTGGATVEDVKLLKSVVKDKALGKASGGIRSFETFIAMQKAGADRIGTSNGPAIIDESKNQ